MAVVETLKIVAVSVSVKLNASQSDCFPAIAELDLVSALDVDP